eukprot:gene35932-44306_t
MIFLFTPRQLAALNAAGIMTPLLPLPRDERIDKKLFIQHVYAE